MCRFLIYKGPRTVIAELVTRPEHSLIHQSFKALMREEPLNGDGFGVGWYAPEASPVPALFTSLTPAWANLNLQRLAEVVATPCLFAHVRAASPGLRVSEANCHPFRYRNLLWMHNGFINEFHKIKRRLTNFLRDEYYNIVEGTTDSEHAFALFLNFLPEGKESYTLEELADAMLATIKQLNVWSEDAGVEGPSTMNFAVTDGEKVVVTRYASNTKHKPESLYYSQGARFECKDGVCSMRSPKESSEAIIVTSEPVTENKKDWVEIQPNQMLKIDRNNAVEMVRIPSRNE